MWKLPGIRTRNKPVSKQRKRTKQLAIEQMEPRWLFNASPVPLFDSLENVDDWKLFDDLRQDVNVLDDLEKLRDKSGAGSAAAADAMHDSGGGGGGGGAAS